MRGDGSACGTSDALRGGLFALGATKRGCTSDLAASRTVGKFWSGWVELPLGFPSTNICLSDVLGDAWKPSYLTCFISNKLPKPFTETVVHRSRRPAVSAIRLTC